MKFIEDLDGEQKKYLYDLYKNSPVYRMRQRAHALLLSNRKYSIDAIADIFEVHRDTVSRWFVHWKEKGIDGLKDAPKPGRPKRNDGQEKERKKLYYKTLSSLKRN
jgi:transposase